MNLSSFTAAEGVLKDLVIDTNVFMHADNDQESRREQSRDMLSKMQSGNTVLCVDEGFDFNESKNKSYIVHEYLKWAVQGTFAYAVLFQMLRNSRIKVVPRKTSRSVQKVIQQDVHDRTDRVFVQVAANTEEKVLASHDLANFPKVCRKSLLNSIGVSILVAREVSDRL